MVRQAKVLCALGALLVAGGCAGRRDAPADADGPGIELSARRPTPTEASISEDLPPSGLSVRWKYAHVWGFVCAPAVATDGTIYACAEDSQLLAFGPEGDLRWQLDTGNVATGTPALATDGTIYVGTRDGYVIAVSPKGELLWRFFTPGSIAGAPVLDADGAVYFGSDDGCLYALLPDGTQAWRCRLGEPREYGGFAVSRPSLGYDGTLYVAAGRLCAVRPNGQLLWSRDELRPSAAPLVMEDGTLRFLEARVGTAGDWCDDMALRAATADGEPLWERPIDSGPAGPLQATPDGRLYVPGAAGARWFTDAGEPAGRAEPVGQRARSNILLAGDGACLSTDSAQALHTAHADGGAGETVALGPTARRFCDRSWLAWGPRGTLLAARADGWLLALSSVPSMPPRELGPGVAPEEKPRPFRRDIGPFVQRVRCGLREDTIPVSEFAGRGAWAQPAVPALIELRNRRGLRDSTRDEALAALCGLASTCEGVVPELIKGLDDPAIDPYRRKTVVETLGRAGSQARGAAPALRRLARGADGRPDARELAGAALLALGRIGDTESISMLIEVAFPSARTGYRPLSHPAQMALAALGGPAIAEVSARARSDDAFQVQDACLTLAAMGRDGVPALLELADSPVQIVSGNAIAALPVSRCEEAAVALESRMDSETDPQMRRRLEQAARQVREGMARHEEEMRRLHGAAARP